MSDITRVLMTRRFAVLALAAVLGAGGACGPGEQPGGRETVVDSAVSIDTLLARFRHGLDHPAELTGGAGSLDALLRAFAAAVERRDSSAFAALAITRAEFAWLYYPFIPEAAPPYELEPGMMWFMIETNSGRGLRALLAERGGRPLGLIDHTCEGERRFDELTLWGPCTVRRLQAPGDTVAEVLFGPVVSRHGRFKFVSYANKL
jgi:hypothetical protein